MALYDKSETAKIAATGTATAATFASGVREVHIMADGDCFIGFDEDVATVSSFLVKANVEPHPFVFQGGGPLKVWAITSGGSVNVYVLVIR